MFCKKHFSDLRSFSIIEKLYRRVLTESQSPIRLCQTLRHNSKVRSCIVVVDDIEDKRRNDGYLNTKSLEYVKDHRNIMIE